MHAEEREQHEPVRPICIVCQQPKESGIRIVTEFLCESCEAELVRTDVQDEKYPFYIRQLKRIWYQQNA
ncbi:hypothetical protein J31TS4_46650 [Paenibacillus sp. J31TS4]|uniref:sigma factor G inhibitor Gin n=1 Tax=Paenibacillus sp. J31TS4 TaxID=2807195 RepID=UPI001B13EC90|nr:sigma factor G inhibitor Gin [Paenibacillus sp. J31TS4]GIP41385.1 hypothetical protein J31TS4_46650 [Paenibacillus sp. J31TS4]